jgi:transposase
MCQRSQALPAGGYTGLASVFLCHAGERARYEWRSLPSRRTQIFRARLKIIWADQAYQGHDLADWCQATGDWKLEVDKRMSGTRGRSQQPKRWIVDRTFAWLLRNRRPAVDYERKVQSSETLIEVAMIRLLLARLGRQA